ncbi:TolC family protein [Chitinophagaceae bacterium LB-8]|uniref:TolC family protein n=1 Tax=Paraflavisolibacter caeni TaxID=2982496 RepID=A0A9X3BIV2_9BACT|nr:TolC family protein [Paraflavisolibacter caeni]MCU7551992.1 TolC family protein [Paraflavisolibacter caeni]
MNIKDYRFVFLFLLMTTIAHAQQFDEAFRHLVESAYEKNDSIKVNNIRIQQAKIDEQTTRYNYLPRLSGNATYTRLNDDIIFPQNLQALLLGAQRVLVKEGAGIPFNSQLPSSIKLQPVPPVQDKNILKVTGNTQWVLFSGFKVENGIKAYQHQQKAISYGNEKQMSRLLIDIADLYDKLALLYASDSVIKSSQAILDEQSRFVEGAIKNGLATPLERKKIELARQKLQLRIVENEGSRITLMERLHQLTGVDFPTLSNLHPNLRPMLLTNDTAIAERPEIKSLNEAIKATHYKEKAELSDYIPKLAAFGQYEFRDKSLSMFDPRWYAGLKLQWNLFDGFTARNNARKAALDRKAYEVQKQAVEELVELGQARSRQELRTANQKVNMVNAQEALAKETLDFVSKQYKNGLTNLTEFLNALNDLEKARFDLQQAFYEQRKASLQLLDVNGTLLNNF